MEENKKKYGVLMARKTIDEGIYIFRPQYIIEGEIIEQEDEIDTKKSHRYFLDNIGNSYLLVNDSQATYDEEELAVGYIINEKDLLERYERCSIEEAKAEYLDELLEITHVGYYLYNADLIAITPMDFRSLAITLNNMKIDPNSEIIKIPESDIYGKKIENEFLNSANDEATILISLEELKKIIDTKDLKEMKELLEDLYSKAEAVANKKQDSSISKVDKNSADYIRKLFTASYDALLNFNTIEEVKNAINMIEEMYIGLSLKIDEKEKEGYDVDAANEYLSNIIDKYDELLKLQDLNDIKAGVCKIRDEERSNIERIALKYESISKEEQPLEKEESKKELSAETADNININVREMKNFFDKKIIGQDNAKKDVISAIAMNSLSDNTLDKNSCLLVGPTGSGKTLIAETISEYLDKPMVVIDTTQLTIPGYVGANLEDFLSRLVDMTKGDVKKAEEGIVVFDEIDKKGSVENADISGKGVLNTLLPFIQGTTYDFTYNHRTIHFNTSKLTIFATGAFTDVAKGKKESVGYDETKIGFNKINNNDKKEDIKYRKLEIEDFVKYGKMPVELMGRFTTIAQLSGHTKESLKTILTDSNISTLKLQKEKLEKLKIELKWTEGYLDAVAEKALKLKTGARSLKNTVELSIKEARWEVLNNLDIYAGIILNEKSVEDNLNCLLVDKGGNTYNLKDIINAKNETSLRVLTK